MSNAASVVSYLRGCQRRCYECVIGGGEGMEGGGVRKGRSKTRNQWTAPYVDLGVSFGLLELSASYRCPIVSVR